MNDNIKENRFLENENKNNYKIKNNKINNNEIYENETYYLFELKKKEENDKNSKLMI